MRKNHVLAKLRAGQATAGLWMNNGSPLLAELAAHAGFDWILMDIQHGYWSHSAILSALQVISATDTIPVARPARNDPALIGQLLDAGALGIVVPLVNSAEEAAHAVAAMRYPPYGQRSAGGSRLPLYGDDYFSKANGEILAGIMVETREAAEHADEILAVPGVDLCFIGPTDLALSMGVFGQASSEHEALIQNVLRAGRAAGVAVGIYCGSPQEAIRRAEQGFQFMPCAHDVDLFTQGIRKAVGEWRNWSSPRWR